MVTGREGLVNEAIVVDVVWMVVLATLVNVADIANHKNSHWNKFFKSYMLITYLSFGKMG